MSASYWHEKRQRIYDWMVANNLESYAHLYKGAVLILYQQPPGYIRFVAHAVRDLMNGMAACKLGQRRSQVDYTYLVGELHQLWESHALPKGTETLDPAVSGDPLNANISLPGKITVQIQILLREHEEGRQRSADSPYLFFQAFLPNPEKPRALPEPYPKMWKELRKWFLEQCHENGNLPEKTVLNQLEDKFKQIEDIMLSVADRYSNTINTVDEILDQANA